MLEFGIVNSTTLDLDGICKIDKKKGRYYRPFFYSFIIFTMKSNLFVIFLIFLTACSESIKPVDTAVENQILYIGNGTEPQDLDPHIVTGVPESKVLMALLEGLVIRNPDGPTPLPGVAMNWDISNDGKTYTFYLRKNASGLMEMLSLLMTLFMPGKEFYYQVLVLNTLTCFMIL